MTTITRSLPPELAPYAQDLEEFDRKTGIRLSFPPLGTGGGGTVLKAQQGDRPLAVKVIAAEDAATKEQALREARILKQVQQAKAIGGGEGLLWQKHYANVDLYFLGMDFIPGQTLTELIAEQGPLAEPLAIELAIGIAEELEALHAQHIIHRDVKPDNVIMLRLGQHFQPIVVDYGIAKVGKRTERYAKAATDGYAPPEQYQGGTDRRTDVYALGATLYEMVTGLTPLTSINRDPKDVLEPHLSTPALSLELTLIIQIATAYHARQRFSSMGVLKDALRLAQDGNETVFWATLQALGVVSGGSASLPNSGALLLTADEPQLSPLPLKQPTPPAKKRKSAVSPSCLMCPVCHAPCLAGEAFCNGCGAALYLGASAPPVSAERVSEGADARTLTPRTPSPQFLSLLFAHKIVLGGPPVGRLGKGLLLLGYWFLLLGIALGARSLSIVCGLVSGVTVGCAVFFVVLFPLFAQLLFHWSDTTITRRGQLHWLPRGVVALLGLGGLAGALDWMMNEVGIWQSAWFLNPPPLSMLVYGVLVCCGALLVKALLA